MGLTTLSVEVGNPSKPAVTERIDFLIDSGAIYSVVAAAVLKRLRIRPLIREEFRLAGVAAIPDRPDRVDDIARAEAPGPGDHQRPDGRIGLGAVQRGPQVVVHLARETVEGLRAVQGHDGDAALLAVQDGGWGSGFGHACLLKRNLPLADRSVG